MRRKTIIVIYTGGTIGMVAGPRGLVPSADFASCIEEWITGASLLANIDCRIVQCDPLIDSADASPASWHRLADLLWAHRAHFDGAVIVHGTDTLPYTASALSFLLSHLGKPTVLTGAQIPFSAPKSDARDNFLGAMRSAASEVCEVCIFFDGTLLRGNRTRKRGTQRGESFVSAHWPALGVIDSDLQLSRSALLPQVALPHTRAPAPIRDGSIGLIKVYPGIGSALLQAAAAEHPAGLVLELYGVGTGPAGDLAVRRALERIARQGTVIVGVSQCVRGVLSPNLYEAGRILAETGVVNGYDLTAEAALTKLHVLWCERRTSAAAMQHSIAGEMTIANRP